MFVVMSGQVQNSPFRLIPVVPVTPVVEFVQLQVLVVTVVTVLLLPLTLVLFCEIVIVVFLVVVVFVALIRGQLQTVMLPARPVEPEVFVEPVQLQVLLLLAV